MDRLRFSPRSPFLLLRELRDRGVDGALAGKVLNDTLEEEGSTPDDLARQVAEAWIRKQALPTLQALDGPRFTREREGARRRLLGHLSRRGFSGDQARAGLERGIVVAREHIARDEA